MRVGDLVRIDLGFGSAHCTTGFETADGSHLVLAHEPVAGRHWLSVVEQWCVADDDGGSIGTAHDYLEGTAWGPADQLADGSDIVAHAASGG